MERRAPSSPKAMSQSDRVSVSLDRSVTVSSQWAAAVMALATSMSSQVK
jgi:hypothetical protein